MVLYVLHVFCLDFHLPQNLSSRHTQMSHILMQVFGLLLMYTVIAFSNGERTAGSPN